MAKHYEPEFKDLHPQVRHTAQWVFEHEARGQDLDGEAREAVVLRAITTARKHVQRTYGIEG